MSEIFSEKTIKNIPLINKHIVEKRPEEHGIDDPDILPRIFSRANSHKNTTNRKERIIL